MSVKPEKKYPTIGCCGLDCGLCPRYYTEGSSKCPGCAGTGFYEKHPSCGYITCCVNKKGLEVCCQCDEFRCGRFDPWKEDGPELDSFISYRKAAFNMSFIKKNGLKRFLGQQEKRILLLEKMLDDFDDGRSKNLYCLAAALLSVKALEGAIKKVEKNKCVDKKEMAKVLKEVLNELAEREGLELTLRKKS